MKNRASNTKVIQLQQWYTMIYSVEDFGEV